MVSLILVSAFVVFSILIFVAVDVRERRRAQGENATFSASRQAAPKVAAPEGRDAIHQQLNPDTGRRLNRTILITLVAAVLLSAGLASGITYWVTRPSDPSTEVTADSASIPEDEPVDSSGSGYDPSLGDTGTQDYQRELDDLERQQEEQDRIDEANQRELDRAREEARQREEEIERLEYERREEEFRQERLESCERAFPDADVLDPCSSYR